MNERRRTGEPSVEDILLSIKNVIAQDERASATELHSTEKSSGIDESGGAETGDDLDEDDVFELVEAVELEQEDSAEVEDEQKVPLVTENSRVSMRDTLSALAMLAQPAVQPQIVRSGETSLEGLARELLRPMLADWLDKNLPPLVERLVAAEIARIMGKKG